MPKTEPVRQLPQNLRNLAPEELKSVTHGDFWIPEAERELYKRALQALNEAGVPYVVAGAYAIYEHTGIYRKTKDLDLFVGPGDVVRAMETLKGVGFRARLEQSHWLAKALDGELFIDIIYGMGNGLALIDPDWHAHSTPAILAATPVRVAPPEELIWHRLFINERHRHDMADIVHLILTLGHRMDWRRLVDKTGRNWPLLLSQLQLFRFVYPGHARQVPGDVLRLLLDRAVRAAQADEAPEAERDLTRGTLISRFSFAIDVNEWGFRDVREELIRRMQASAPIRAIEASGVWDERAADHGDSSVPGPDDAAAAEEGEAA
ncbi:MAG: hypothetical protein JWM27_4940 [Gemmatimonadetes bacterium]|nr:hypothetical protein [Gemmatimonadota bacterium]